MAVAEPGQGIRCGQRFDMGYIYTVSRNFAIKRLVFQTIDLAVNPVGLNVMKDGYIFQLALGALVKTRRMGFCEKADALEHDKNRRGFHRSC